MRLTILLATMTLAIGGCTTAATDAELRDREWQLVSIEGFTTLPSGAATPTVRFGTDGRLGGNTGCNSAGAHYTITGDRITIQPVVSTKRACLDPRGNDLERAYMSAVGRTRSYRIANGELELLDDAGTVLARFR